MFGNPAAERAAIEMTYEDTATIGRTEPATGANHITRAAPAVKYSEIICALSYSGSDKSQRARPSCPSWRQYIPETVRP